MGPALAPEWPPELLLGGPDMGLVVVILEKKG
jgi:hypothetical protein